MKQLDIQLNELKIFSIKNLKRLLNSEHLLFHSRECLRSHKIESDFSYRYSIIALLGLYAHQKNPAINTVFNLKQLHSSLVHKSKNCRTVENLGLLLWLDAQNGCEFLPEILTRLENLKPESGLKNLPTYELAWLLTGLSYALQNAPALQQTKWAEVTNTVFQQFQKRYCRCSGLFFHCASANMKSRIRQNISDFADQIYSVYAGATFFQLSQNQDALEMARNCAHRLAELQGPAGEWWWLYHTTSGSVAYRYPVYTVHQDGMAPMAFIKLTEVAHENWEPVINRSFSWLFARNGFIKIDFAALKIIRGIRIMPPFIKHLAVLLSLMGLNEFQEKIFYRYFKRFAVINEYRAYHLGWILYFIGYREKLKQIHG